MKQIIPEISRIASVGIILLVTVVITFVMNLLSSTFLEFDTMELGALFYLVNPVLIGLGGIGLFLLLSLLNKKNNLVYLLIICTMITGFIIAQFVWS